MDMDKLFKAMIADDYNEWCTIFKTRMVTKSLLRKLASIENLSEANLRQARYLILQYANPDAIEVAASHIFDNNYEIIAFISESFKLGLKKEQVKLFALPEFSLYQMKIIRAGFLEGLSIEEVKTFADPKMHHDEMKAMRDNLINNKKVARLKELFQHLLTN